MGGGGQIKFRRHFLKMLVKLFSRQYWRESVFCVLGLLLIMLPFF